MVVVLPIAPFSLHGLVISSQVVNHHHHHLAIFLMTGLSRDLLPSQRHMEHCEHSFKAIGIVESEERRPLADANHI